MFKIRLSELKEKIVIQIKIKLDKPQKDIDGKPLKYITKKIKTRAKVKYLYGTEALSTEKTENVQKLDFYVRNRQDLKSLDVKGVITFNNKDFNIKYVNAVYVDGLGEILEIRGEHYYEIKN